MSGDEPLDDICAEFKHIRKIVFFRNPEQTRAELRLTSDLRTSA